MFFADITTAEILASARRPIPMEKAAEIVDDWGVADAGHPPKPQNHVREEKKEKEQFHGAA